MKKNYKSQTARDAEKIKYGNGSYWDYLEETAIQYREYYLSREMPDLAEKMMTRSLEEALQGNDGN